MRGYIKFTIHFLLSLNQICKGFFHFTETGYAQIEEEGNDSKAEQEARQLNGAVAAEDKPRDYKLLHSFLPVTGSSVEIGYGNNAEVVGFDLIDDPIRKAVYQTAQSVLRHRRPCGRILDDSCDGSIDLCR